MKWGLFQDGARCHVVTVFAEKSDLTEERGKDRRSGDTCVRTEED